MPLHIRRRGAIWHVRGTVRIGREKVAVPEFSTGTGTRADAEAIAAAEEARVRAEHLEGAAGRARRYTIADAFEAYLQRPGGVRQYDRDRVRDLSDRIGDYPLAAAGDAWQAWLTDRGKHMAPGTAARWRAILQAALNHGARAHGAIAPRLPSVREPPAEVIHYLAIEEQDRLLAAYSSNAAPVALVLCFAGLRTQEALRLDWRHVDWRRSALFIAESKTGRGRTVPMHPRVLEALIGVWGKQREPIAGPVFLSARGQPYADTRGLGGNPLRKAHATACRRAGITGFRVHDWRHHAASWLVMTGTDLYTLQRIMGWSTPRMAMRYAAVSHDHMAVAVGRMR